MNLCVFFCVVCMCVGVRVSVCVFLSTCALTALMCMCVLHIPHLQQSVVVWLVPTDADTYPSG